MPKTNGNITKEKILEIAEKLFSEKGFDAASINMISRAAGINKATIYYHFKDKNDIIKSLFNKIIAETEERINSVLPQPKNLNEKIKNEILYLKSKRKILSIMLMESLKDEGSDNPLFQCSEAHMKHEFDAEQIAKLKNKKQKQMFYIFEFYTGLMPVILFVIFQDKWCEYFGCDKSSLLDDFINILEITHLKKHL